VSTERARRKSEGYVPSGFGLVRHLQAALSTRAVPQVGTSQRVQITEGREGQTTFWGPLLLLARMDANLDVSERIGIV